MMIHESSNVPDGTYFRTGDAEPTINEDGSITILNGRGSRRGWGQPQVNSTVIHDEDDLVAIHVGYSHKHGGGQFWRYYTTNGATTSQLTWAQLPDEARAQVLAASTTKAPGWAKEPGKLRSQYAKPNTHKATAYKIVRQLDELNAVAGAATEYHRMVGLYDGTAYTIGKRLAERNNGRVTDYGDAIHDGGFYSHPSPEQVKALLAQGNLVPSNCLQHGWTLALVECEISGKIVRYPNGKLCSSYLTPVRVVEILSY